MELKEGMYVRTKDGAIAKAEQIIDDEIHFDIKPIFSDGECLGYRWFYVKDVIKTSNNIIDLIEVGDYVNGCYVDEIISDNDSWDDRKHFHLLKFISYFSEEDIKSIVTKEQFESMQYKVGE